MIGAPYVPWWLQPDTTFTAMTPAGHRQLLVGIGGQPGKAPGADEHTRPDGAAAAGAAAPCSRLPVPAAITPSEHNRLRGQNGNTMSTTEHLAKAMAWLDAHPALNQTETFSVHVDVTPVSCRISIWPSNADGVREARRAVGTMDKKERAGGGGMKLDATVDGIHFTVWPPDGICRQVKTGTKVERVAKVVAAAVIEEVEEEVDVYEWECGDVLGEVPA